MEAMMTVLRQIAQMLLLAGLGYGLRRCGKIDEAGSRALGNVLIYLALPAVIINSFQVTLTQDYLLGILYSAGGALILLSLSMLVSRLIFRRDTIAVFAAAFSNPGFFGVPLIVATVGQNAVFYIACFIAFLNISQWTFGVSVLTERPVLEGFRPKAIIRAPFVIAILVGLLLFLTQIRLPALISSCLSAVSSLNTPLAMFVIGIYLAQINPAQMIRHLSVYAVSAVRLLLIPILSFLLISLFPEALHDMKMALLMVAACPVGANVAVYAHLHSKDYTYATETVVMSTLLSVLTMPPLVLLAEMMW